MLVGAAAPALPTAASSTESTVTTAIRRDTAVMAALWGRTHGPIAHRVLDTSRSADQSPLMARLQLPEWVVFPGEDWVEITPREAGLESAGFEAFLAGLDVEGASFGGEDHSGGRWGAVLTRGGYLVHAWGDRDYRFQTARRARRSSGR